MNQDNQVEWKNEVDRAVVELAKICQTTPITEEIRTFASMVVENKRRQDEVEYVRSLQEKIERLEYEKSRVAKESYAEGIRRARERVEKEWSGNIIDLMDSIRRLEEEVNKV